MDAYEATKVVFARIQGLDPDHAAKIMGLLLIQDHGEKEMIRLAFGPEALLLAVMAKARKDLGLLPGSGPGTPTSAAHSPFMLSRQNSGRGGGCGGGTAPSPLSVSSPSSWAPPPVFSRSNSVSNGAAEEMAGVGEEQLMSPANGGGGPQSPFFGGDSSLILDELHLQDQLAFLSEGGMGGGGGRQLPLFDSGECRSPSGDGGLFPYGAGWANGGPGHRRSASVSELCFGGSDGLGWKPCLYYARGYCKNGSACRFVHGGLPDDLAGAKMDQAAVEQQCQDFLLRSKSQRLAAAAGFAYSPTGSLPGSPSAASKCLSLLLKQQQQQNEGQRAAAAAAAAALMLGGDEAHKFMNRPRLDRGDFASMMNPGSRQIYLTFPADSTFREEDVSNYFSIYGPVHDVRIPYQQKRMFGFVTFVYPETVKLILAKGNPHFICDARVLVKPYKEKGKVPDKFRKQQGERVDFSGCGSPTGLDARDPFDLHQIVGARMLQHSNSANEMLLRRKLEEQQQAVELQQAIELQSRRLMGLQLLDLKTRSAAAPTPIGKPFSPTHTTAATPTLESPPDSGITWEQGNGCGFLFPHKNAVNGADKDETSGDSTTSPNTDSDQSAEHNLPDSPFASPTRSGAFARDPFAPTESEIAAASTGCNAAYNGGINSNGARNGGINHHLLPPALDIPSPKPYFFPMSRLSSDHGAVGM
ncbi:zinc finger CCCH domain-containing protein 53-like isoform X1 [Triticum dicoccoides]|uniref:zinc finger CCCH domain-containing protein 53-like isoform X1 n=1 Tax=Triticum dicoccoides TaxID=85692 RepID=UPI00189073D9|nr:zinc finger CCCH domain-containing protein 53-like isoform X1 [Triticum dicoccoides]